MDTLISNINISKSELKCILKEVKCLTGFDFSSYSHCFIKRRTEFFMIKNKILSENDLIYKINNSSNFAETFIDNVFFQQYELFRDVEVWNYIESKIIPKLVNKTDIKIHFPYSSGAEDLYSFLFILKNFNVKNFQIFVTGVTDKHISIIKNAIFSKLHVKASEKNISLLNLATDKDDVFSPVGKNFKVKKNYNGSLHFSKCGFFKGQYLSEFDLVFFKNKTIFFNNELKAKALNFVVRSLKKGAFVVLGEKESINNDVAKKIKSLQKGLSIYKRKTFSL